MHECSARDGTGPILHHRPGRKRMGPADHGESGTHGLEDERQVLTQISVPATPVVAAITLETAVSAGRVTDVGMGNLASSEPHVQSRRIGSNSGFDGHGSWIAGTQPSARIQSQTGAVTLNAGEVVGSLPTGRVRLDECLVGSGPRPSQADIHS